MADEERTYGAGEDIPGTPGPFPFGLLAIGPATASAAIFLFAPLIGVPGWIAWLLAGVWLVMAVIGVSRGSWIGPIAGLGLIAVGATIASMGGLGS